MGGDKKNILCINGGSSSIKFSVYSEGLTERLRGKIDRIGLDGASLSFLDSVDGKEGKVSMKESGMAAAANFLLDWLGGRKIDFSAIGHRVVHGATRRQPAIINDDLLAELDLISGYDPDHLPGEI